mmetsp:Transcript_7264/g.18436  ORF Transcript_7264/g.18436 Transcript_7264/m.18436 type:complete len:640 (+) Transcript_7264:93-2012(+)|eukprot:CAMPEP_0168724470 /NCGR_PEP_ID=MMETSP0724-20121128/3652_1 /TAXON_ID=265536 /ORGANISM="Amphiprora sp., Strain CCMP467" /LENGTH=639 /DNA_ID=CAMNT_0008771219 /DNA_START=27 /DNA_END=1946 /DNA_ORIENTATION=-
MAASSQWNRKTETARVVLYCCVLISISTTLAFQANNPFRSRPSPPLISTVDEESAITAPTVAARRHGSKVGLYSYKQQHDTLTSSRTSRFVRMLRFQGRRRPVSSPQRVSTAAPSGATTEASLKTSRSNKEEEEEEEPVKYSITTLDELESYFRDDEQRFRNDKDEIQYGDLLRALSVEGDTQNIGSPEEPEFVHSVAQLIHHRKKTDSAVVPDGQVREDGCRLALAIEGGGMRGCVSAGMICALGHLNLTNVFDVVYGSSAGTIVGAYLITDQLQWFGPEVYYDQLTTAGRAFINTRRIMRALGLGLLNPALIKDVIVRRNNGKPILNLNFLLKRTVQKTKPLDWESFVKKQEVQPLRVVASGLKSEKAVVMDMKGGHFDSLEELTDCMHASCLLPGIAGPLMNLDKSALHEKDEKKPKLVAGNGLEGDQFEPLADALVCEPLPYRSALEEGCTHVLVIRSRPDGRDVTGKSSFFENLIFRRFFLRKNKLPRIYEFFRRQLHKKLYAEDMIILNEGAKSNRDPFDAAKNEEGKVANPHLMTVAAPPGSAEVTRLETGREAIFEGFRRGFARAYDCLVEDPAERGRGTQVAKEFFPDEILDYNPTEIHDTQESAFDVYLRKSGVKPKAWAQGSDDHVSI